MSLVEAGAQGEHKVKRGYLPCLTHSLHRFTHPGLNHAIGDLVKREREAMQPELEQWQREGPFKADCVPPFPAVAGVPLPSPRQPEGANDDDATSDGEAP